MKLIKKLRFEIIFFLIFCLSRAPYIGQEMFNTDTWKWKQRIYDFGSGVFNLDFDKTLQKYHPGVTLMWIGTAAVKFQGIYCSVLSCADESVNPIGAVFELHFFQKLFIDLAIGLTLAFIFYPLRKMFGVKYAFISLTLLSFEPFYYALTRVVHLEGLMTSLMLAAFVWLFYALSVSKKTSHFVLSGFFAGLSMLTKSSAAFIIPFSMLLIAAYYTKNRKFLARVSGMWLLSLIATYFILWPSMWVHPIKTLDYVFVRGIKETGFEDEHGQLYYNKYTENTGPFFYFVVAGYKFSPVLLTGIILFIVFCPKIQKSFDGSKFNKFLLAGLIFTAGYWLEITIPTKKLDRYILPALASLSLIAGFSYVWLIKELANRRLNKKAVSIAAISIFTVMCAYQSLSLTPDYFSYFNPLFGGLGKGIFVLEPKWIIGQHEIAGYFGNLLTKENLKPFGPGESFDNQKNLSNRLTVAFPEKYYTQAWPFIRRIGGWAVIEDLTPNAKKTTYFVYPVWDDYSNRETRFRLTYVDSIYLRSVKLYNVYKRI